LQTVRPVAARVRGVGCGNGVGFPDVHLVTAGTEVALAGVGAVAVRNPAHNVGLSIDELEIVGALGIAVASAVLRASRVGARSSSIGGHLREVESAVQAARKLRNVDVESELLVEQIERFV